MKLVIATVVMISALQSFAKTESFRMYDQPRKQVDTFCNRYTQLQLDIEGTVGTATVSNHLEGACEIYVPENKKTYRVALKDSSCGSKIYVDVTASQPRIEIVDNRTRICEDVIPALIVMKLLGRDGRMYPFYSQDR